MSRFFRPGWLLIYIGLFVFSFQGGRLGGLWGNGQLDIYSSVLVKSGDTLQNVYAEVGEGADVWGLKRYHKQHPEALTTLQPGSYIFSGAYTYPEFFEFLDAGPQVSYETITLLEGWSIYDIDEYFVQQGYLEPGVYRDYVTNPVTIAKYKATYDFLDGVSGLSSLEGFLYPETYFVDVSKDFLEQVVSLQLNQFEEKVRSEYSSQIEGLRSVSDSRSTLDWYELLTLASVIEKEERVDSNKAKIAGVFLNRIKDDMRIDADITLCYAFAKPYNTCTPRVIGDNVGDATNIYNTRAVPGLPPTPIANIHVSSMNALIDAEISDYYFYLHDNEGGIHLAEDLAGHNVNKRRYID